MADNTKYPYRPGDPYGPKTKPFFELTPEEQNKRKEEVAKEVQAMRERLAKLPPAEIKKELEKEATETIEETNDKMSQLNKLAIGLGIGALGVAISYLGSTRGGVSRKLKRKRNKTSRRVH
jgi:hypothetical protein